MALTIQRSLFFYGIAGGALEDLAGCHKACIGVRPCPVSAAEVASIGGRVVFPSISLFELSMYLS